MKLQQSQYSVKIAQSVEEISAAQRLRYRVFVAEKGAQVGQDAHAAEIEIDAYDQYYQHLILIDSTCPDPRKNVVGAYRLITDQQARNGAGFYGRSEYDLQKLTGSGRRLLEVGRSCIAREHRGGIALFLIWQALTRFVMENEIDVLFGVASFSGIEPRDYAQALSYLHHYHLAPDDLRVQAIGENAVAMDMVEKHQIDRLKALGQIPPLIKSYLRLGGFVGQGAFVDTAFNTLDVCLLLDVQRMNPKQRQLYSQGVR
ncbi:ornithine-acyl-ACP acyltransferase [Amylibacter marinus]|uniref:L-ornithine N(alpha)-acyltransferase n=1 Tax=Amylibacter marinus TaxID=1475483 RepID=A0ABQ5VXM7_9RHOB|nr:GNAT family N-acyltransferase [Amylibacter marinus]GLQ36039.1 ornithine-acyl-ACP acyltransferase [Amylibacter marinus]